MEESITQKRCKKCGGTDFYKKGWCKACAKVSGKNRYIEHKEEMKAYKKKYDAEHPESRRARGRRYCARHREEGIARCKKRRAEHPEEASVSSKAWRAENPEEHRIYNKNYYNKYPERAIARRHGMTENDYKEMLAAQDGVCAICGLLPNNKRLFIDHSHETGEVRGMLCNHCNFMLGFALDNAKTLRRGADYLEKMRKP